ncbi:hypothetical protein CH373_08810 [Leptospira perolatii]|uniref:DUF3147 family protein n=1 Tax=Leptospira perolatii TaxID=2023191 RepID=A0A2M9ZND3_9LEPT|nr:hypothetical protein CH360_09955 [Leptospira perolatii]PJZ73588.1 hypothetical protein CH373_08810 [Leptospira perolatii]
MFYAIKIFISALIIFVVTEVSKKNSVWAGLLASLPLVTILSVLWIYSETKEVDTIIRFIRSVFWMVLPTLGFLLIFPFLLEKKTPFPLALAISVVSLFGLYYIMIRVLGMFESKS